MKTKKEHLDQQNFISNINFEDDVSKIKNDIIINFKNDLIKYLKNKKYIIPAIKNTTKMIINSFNITVCSWFVKNNSGSFSIKIKNNNNKLLFFVSCNLNNNDKKYFSIWKGDILKDYIVDGTDSNFCSFDSNTHICNNYQYYTTILYIIVKQIMILISRHYDSNIFYDKTIVPIYYNIENNKSNDEKEKNNINDKLYNTFKDEMCMYLKIESDNINKFTDLLLKNFSQITDIYKKYMDDKKQCYLIKICGSINGKFYNELCSSNPTNKTKPHRFGYYNYNKIGLDICWEINIREKKEKCRGLIDLKKFENWIKNEKVDIWDVFSL